MRNCLIISLLIVFSSVAALAQTSSKPVHYQVDYLHPALSIDRSQLSEATDINGLNQYFDETWVAEYKSVAITAIVDSKEQRAFAQNDKLTNEQISILRKVDSGTEIKVDVNYIPDNSLSHNDVKTYSFSFQLQPETMALFPGGAKALDNYLEAKLARHIKSSDLDDYVLASATFIVDDSGNITDINLFNSSRDAEIDKVLLDAVRDMPSWTPARYADGRIVSQSIAVSIGDPESCSINLLKMR